MVQLIDQLTQLNLSIEYLNLQKNPSSSNYYLHDPPCCQCTMPSMTNIWALMIKNFIKLKRNIRYGMHLKLKSYK